MFPYVRVVFEVEASTTSFIPLVQLGVYPGGPVIGICSLSGMNSLFVNQVLPCFFKALSQEDVELHENLR